MDLREFSFTRSRMGVARNGVWGRIASRAGQPKNLSSQDHQTLLSICLLGDRRPADHPCIGNFLVVIEFAHHKEKFHTGYFVLLERSLLQFHNKNSYGYADSNFVFL